jgi:predicted amidophosphoribosyltransferase
VGRVDGIGAALADLVLPRACAGCGLPGRVLCRTCAPAFARPRVAAPRRVPWGFPPTVAAAAYDGPVRPAVIAFKDRGRAELARPLGAALALAVGALLTAAPQPGRPVALVPVPSSRVALRSRGRDHVRELAVAATRELRAAGVGADVVRVLHRRGRVRDSAGLGAEERRVNLTGSFALRGEPPDDVLAVLVDDVVTTGATLAEAAAALADRRPPASLPVVAAVVAATPRRPAKRLSAVFLDVPHDGPVTTPDRLSDRLPRD